jgi:hypothetical protein
MQGLSQDQPLTVGQPFELVCDGEMSVPLTKTAQFVWPDENAKYTLQLLEVRDSTLNHFTLLVTSYRVGEHKDLVAKISDGTTTVETSPLQLKVATVLEQGDEPKPEPSVGPFYISYPLWLWFSIAGAILIILLTGFFVIYRKRARQKVLQELDKYMTMLPPFSQFSKDLRVFVRDLGMHKPDVSAGAMAQRLDEIFRLYLVRELRVPAHTATDAEVMREIRRTHRFLFDDLRADLHRTLSELSHAKDDLSKITFKDCEDLLYLVRSLADKIQALVRVQKKRHQRKGGD